MSTIPSPEQCTPEIFPEHTEVFITIEMVLEAGL
jgi:hypothetical protein